MRRHDHEERPETPDDTHSTRIDEQTYPNGRRIEQPSTALYCTAFIKQELYYKKVRPTPKLRPFLPSSPLRMTSGSEKLTSNLAAGCAYTRPKPAAVLGRPLLRSLTAWAKLLCTSFELIACSLSCRVSLRARRRPALMNVWKRRGVSLPRRGRGKSREAPPAA